MAKKAMALKDLAKEMNEVMGLKPAIKTVAIKEDALLALIKKAAVNIEPDTDIDEFSEEAVNTLKQMELWPEEDGDDQNDDGSEQDPDEAPEEDPDEDDETAAMVSIILEEKDLKTLKKLVKEYEAFSRIRKRATTMFELSELKTQMLLALGYEGKMPTEDDKDLEPQEAPMSKAKGKNATPPPAPAKTPAKEEKKAPAKAPGKKPSVIPETMAFLEPLIAKGKFTQKELVEKVSEKVGITTSYAQTFLTDSRNPKYNKFDKLVVKNEQGILSFKK